MPLTVEEGTWISFAMSLTGRPVFASATAAPRLPIPTSLPLLVFCRPFFSDSALVLGELAVDGDMVGCIFLISRNGFVVVVVVVVDIVSSL